jgi:ankyrin repeat protein
LHAAVVSGIPESVEKLIGHGAGVNARDNKGNTPLHMLRMMKNNKESDDLPELLKVSPGLASQTTLHIMELRHAFPVSWREQSVCDTIHLYRIKSCYMLTCTVGEKNVELL